MEKDVFGSTGPYEGFEGVKSKLESGEFKKLKKKEFGNTISEEALNSVPSRDEMSLE